MKNRPVHSGLNLVCGGPSFHYKETIGIGERLKSGPTAAEYWEQVKVFQCPWKLSWRGVFKKLWLTGEDGKFKEEKWEVGKRRARPQSAFNQGWLVAVLHLLLGFVSETGQESLCELSQLSGDRSLVSRWPSEKWLMLLKIPWTLLFSACCHNFDVSSFDICSSSNYSLWLSTYREWKGLPFKDFMCHYCHLCGRTAIFSYKSVSI